MMSYPTADFTSNYSKSTFLSPPVRTLRSSGFLNAVVMGLLSIFVFVLPTDLRLDSGKSIAMRVGFLCVLLGVVGVLKRRSFNLPSVGFWCLLAFVIWSTFTLAWARYPGFAFDKVVAYWALFIVAGIIPQYAWDPEVRKTLFDAYIAGCWCGVIGVFIRYVSGMQYTAESTLEFEGRYSFGTDPNYLALALVIGLPIAFYRAASTNTVWKKRLFLLYVPAALLGTGLTGSRGASLALLVGVLVFGLFTTVRMRVALLSGTALCLIIALALPSNLSERFLTIPGELRHGTLSDRRDLWDRGTALVQQHPLEGIGAGATAGTFAIAVHNTPLELLMEGGVLSFGLFYGAFLLGIYKARKVDSQERLLMLVVCSIWLVGTLSLSWEVDTVTWFILAMLFSAGSTRTMDVAPSVMNDALAIGAEAR